MAKNLQRPQLIKCNPDNIPESMRRAKRWAPWAAPWDEEKQKYGKVPHRADRPEYGLSNGSASGWVAFEQALAAWRARPDLFAGVGYLMTGKHGVVGVDLDNCVKDGVVAPWAAEIAAKLDSYTEISPSGTGLHIMLEGDLESDWSAKLGPGPHTSKSPGVDVYGGGARFLTVTGAHLAGSPKSLRPAPAALDALAARYRKSKKADLHVLPLPTTYGMELPDLAELGLPPSVRNFLTEGPDPGADRSNLLIGAGAALAKAGLTPEQAFALMSENEHAMEVALSKRQYDDTKAREYLWTHHCRRGAAIVEEDRRLTLDSFEDYPGEDRREGGAKAETPVAEGGCTIDDFDVLEEPELTDEELVAGPVVSRDLAPVKREKFSVQSLATFSQAKATSWIIKGVLPRASLGVVYGDSGAGKTFYVLDQVVAVCRGADWRGHKVKQGRAVYICAEGAAGFQKRLEAYADHHGVALGDIDMGVITDVPSFMDKADIKALGLQLKKHGKIDILVVDTYARVMVGGNENDAKDVGLAIAHCELLHRLTGAMVLLVHHSGKDASRGARGSGALRAAADLEVEVVQTRACRVATVTKMKDGEDGKEYPFKLNTVVLGQDEDGDDITSCVVEHRAADTRAMPRHMKQATPTQLLVLRTLDAAIDMAGTLHYAELKRLAVEQIPCDPDKKKDNRHRDVSKAIETLVELGELVQAEGGNIERANNRT